MGEELMMKLERRVERLERHMVTAEELLAEVRARAILKPDYHPDDVAFTQADRDAWGKMLNDGYTDTTFDRLAAVAQEAVAECRAAIDRAEAAEAEVERLQGKLEATRRVRDTAFRRFNESQAQLRAVTAERDALQEQLAHSTQYGYLSQVFHRMMDSERVPAVGCPTPNERLRYLINQRDALQARIDAGVRVWGSYQYDGLCFAGEAARDETDTHTAILIDPQPIAHDHIADPGKMVAPDPRTGPEDRSVAYSPSPHHRRYFPPDRRSTPGTVADRKPQWTRADGSVNERQGERRKGLEERCINACRLSQCSKSIGPCYTQSEADDYHDNRRDPSGANDRRKCKA